MNNVIQHYWPELIKLTAEQAGIAVEAITCAYAEFQLGKITLGELDDRCSQIAKGG